MGRWLAGYEAAWRAPGTAGSPICSPATSPTFNPPTSGPLLAWGNQTDAGCRKRRP